VQCFSHIKQLLIELGVDRILFAGGFSLSEFLLSAPLAPIAILSDECSRQYLTQTGFLRMGSSDFLTGTAFLRAVQRMLSDSNVVPASIHEFVGSFKLNEGPNSDLHGDVTVEEYVRALRHELASRKLSVAQAFIVSGQRPPIREWLGTRRLLRRFARLNRARSYLLPVLVKLPARGFDARLDMPFIGPQTVSDCKAAGVRGIVFCCDYTICGEMARAISIANEEPQIFLQGFSKDILEAIFSDDEVYLSGLGAAPLPNNP
jgi:hypothetical protein